jgi:hypothetical protein
LQSNLEDLTRRFGLDFVPGVYAAGEEFHEYSHDSIRQRSEFMTSTLERILLRESTSPHWGINE